MRGEERRGEDRVGFEARVEDWKSGS